MEQRKQQITIRKVEGAEAFTCIPALTAVLVDCVEGGASVSFMWPFSSATAEAFWHRIAEVVTAGERLLLVAEQEGEIVGTVQVVLALPENQPHRAEVAKLLVRQSARRQGIAERLMRSVETAALDAGKTLLMLDTVTGSTADRLYRRLDWIPMGVVPRFALMPDGAPCDATIFYKEIKGERAQGGID